MSAATATLDALSPDAGASTRAQRARSEPMAATPLGGGVYDVVTGGDGRTAYTVTVPEGRCTCPDSRIRGATCKHLRRVAIEITAGRLPAPDEREAACARCGRVVHADAAAPDPVYCEACTLRPGETVLDRETEDLVVVVRTTDRRADESPVRGTGETVSSYPGNAAYDSADRVVEVVYPPPADADPDDVAARPPRRYSFPRGRLRRPQ